MQDQARLRSCSGPGSGAFLSALPYLKGCKFTNNAFKAAIQLRIGLPTSPLPSQPVVSCSCGVIPDPSGNHFLSCGRGGLVIARHNSILETLRDILRSTGAHTQSELSITVPPSLPHRSRPTTVRVDVLATSRAFENPVSADVTVTNPVSASATLLARNATQNGSANRAAESRKCTIYESVCRDAGYAFVPFALEVFGRLGSKAESFLKNLASHAANNIADVDLIAANKLHASLLHLWRMKISCALQKGNANAVISGLQRLTSQSSSTAIWSQHIDFGSLLERQLA